MKRSFFQAAIESILLYGCTTWMLTKRMEKKFDGNYTRMLWAILNKSRRQHPIKQQLHDNLPPIMKTIKIRRTRHAGHCWRSRDELISDVLLWTPSHGRAKAGRPARTYIQQLCPDTGCNPVDLPEVMDVWEGWRDWVRDIRADSATWWWWWWWMFVTDIYMWMTGIYLYISTLLLLFGIIYFRLDNGQMWHRNVYSTRKRAKSCPYIQTDKQIGDLRSQAYKIVLHIKGKQSACEYRQILTQTLICGGLSEEQRVNILVSNSIMIVMCLILIGCSRLEALYLTKLKWTYTIYKSVDARVYTYIYIYIYIHIQTHVFIYIYIYI